MSQVTRPVLRYHGGKWRLAPWIIEHFPQHRIYVEPYGGAASVLMQKPRSYAEVYNDLDGEVVNVFRVLREQAEELQRGLVLTPFARDEFEAAYEHTDEPIERARRTIIKSFMGFASSSIHDARPSGMRTRVSTWSPPTGFRSDSMRSGSTPATDWANYPSVVRAFGERLARVVVENRGADTVIQQHDSPETLFYVDPPYVHGVRSSHGSGHGYQHEMIDEDHRELAEILHYVEGMVVLSGYRGDLYEELYPDWVSHDRDTLADGARPRTETLWLNPAAAAAQNQLRLFPSPAP